MASPTGTVTFLFTDIEGSTRLWDNHPEEMRTALARHDTLLRETVEQWGGHVFKTVGDAFCTVFAAAPDAARAALDAQRALHHEDWGEIGAVRVRMALHTGASDERGGDYFGPALNRVARLLAIGHGGQVLVSSAAEAAVRGSLSAEANLRDRGSHRLKDLQQPEHVWQICAPDLPADFPPLRSLQAFANNLPIQATSFVGREQEIAEIERLLSISHLLTLTGSGGVGKTRLALQTAADLLETYSDGVWLVELAPLADPDLVPQTVAFALGVREEPGRPFTQTLADYLRNKKLLLLLDNCEHLVDACARLADTLLRSCPDLQILATSREALGVPGERTYRLPSLGLPDPARLPPTDALEQFEAVRLFRERAQLHQPAFAVTAANAPALAQVCHRLDGIPLAIELAAARVRSLPVEQIAARLDDRFHLLTGGSRTALPRQQTLRALIDWSYGLLTDGEKTLLRRLSIFAGGWTLEAAEAVCSNEGIEDWEVLDLLTRLVDKSLVVYEERDGEARYRLLETVRQYGQERLREAGEDAAVRRQHRDFFLALAEATEPRLHGPEQIALLDALEREHDNFRAALTWSETDASEPEAGLRLAGALFWFWHLRSYLREGRERLERELGRTTSLRDTRARATALQGAGQLAFYQNDYAAARTYLEQSAALWQEIGDQRGYAYALVYLAGEIEPQEFILKVRVQWPHEPMRCS